MIYKLTLDSEQKVLDLVDDIRDNQFKVLHKRETIKAIINTLINLIN